MARFGEGAHAWVFFEEAVPAREARQLGAALISHPYSSTRQLELSSYDRLFPNQNTLPKGGFGNLIALPLQKEDRQQADKTSARIIDWLELGHPVPQRMRERRLRGYRAMGYSLISDP